MISGEAIRRQAANKYPEIVQALLRGEAYFPLVLRYPRIRTTAPREDILADLATLRAEAERGLTIEWRRVETVRYGANDLPGDICLTNETDFLAYIGKAQEMRSIRAAATVLTTAFPALEATLPAHWRLLRSGDPGFWENACRVLRYLRQHPLPDRYPRELPIAVPTKFIECNRALLETLLQLVAPGSYRPEGETFEERLGLRSPDSLVELRLLDDTLRPEWKFRQLTIALSDLPHLAEIPAETFLITENRINFLTLPPLPGVVALQGQGYAVSRLARAAFLQERTLLYWGDLDVQGFEILAVLRRAFPHVRSVFMDEATWEAHADFRQPGVRSRNQPNQFLPHLHQDEIRLYQTLLSSHQRLEQEHIPQRFVEDVLRRLPRP